MVAGTGVAWRRPVPEGSGFHPGWGWRLVWLVESVRPSLDVTPEPPRGLLPVVCQAELSGPPA